LTAKENFKLDSQSKSNMHDSYHVCPLGFSFRWQRSPPDTVPAASDMATIGGDVLVWDDPKRDGAY